MILMVKENKNIAVHSDRSGKDQTTQNKITEEKVVRRGQFFQFLDGIVL